MQIVSGTRFSARALLFDMDGTLIDSTVSVERVWGNWAASHGVSFAKVAHSMKGSASNFGAKHFRHLAENLEAIAKSGNLATATAAIEALRAEYERVVAALAVALAAGK